VSINPAARRCPTYTPEIGDEICDRRESQTLREICADPEMPDRETLQRWLVQEEDFREQYHFLLEILADKLLAEACKISV
jgi:hypothetical protein